VKGKGGKGKGSHVIELIKADTDNRSQHIRKVREKEKIDPRQEMAGEVQDHMRKETGSGKKDKADVWRSERTAALVRSAGRLKNGEE